MSWYDDYQRGMRTAAAAADARDAGAETLAAEYGLTFDPDDECYPKFRDPEKGTVITRCADFRWRSCLGDVFSDMRSWTTAREALAALLGGPRGSSTDR